jgi:16S rRNA (guanine527-N7)-methyltransferase
VISLAAALDDLQLPPALEGALGEFELLFRKWNRSINLSAARTDDELRLQVVDCLHAVPHLRAHPARGRSLRILDVGAGGGLPSVIVALCMPDAHVTALEPVHKKHAFLRTAARELSLANLVPLALRLDAHAHEPADYDAAMSRATFDLPVWLALGLQHVCPGGLVLGFEALARGDLPARATRHPYQLSERSRSVVVLYNHAAAQPA